MGKMKSVVAAFFLMGAMTVQAEAQDRGISGLLLGAGGGAVVGQAIGRDAEGTLIGTVVGGVLGYMAGNEMDKESNHRGYVSAQPAVFLPPPSPPPDAVLAFGGRHDHRPYYRPHVRCKDVVVLDCWHGRCREVVKTTCWERDRWKHRDRHWRGDRHWHRDRDWRHDDRWRDRNRHRDRW